MNTSNLIYFDILFQLLQNTIYIKLGDRGRQLLKLWRGATTLKNLLAAVAMLLGGDFLIIKLQT